MKKVLTIFSLLAGGSLCALPIGNPSEASLLCEGVVQECLGRDVAPFFWDGFCNLSFRTGYYGDFVQNRHLEVDEHFSDGKDVEITEIKTDAGYLAVKIWNRLNLFATFGASHFFLQSNERLFEDKGLSATSERLQLYTETDFSWSIGLRGTLWECGCLAVGGEVQYFATRPDVRFAGTTILPFVYNDEIINLKYREWQAGLGFSYQVNAYFIPYAAIKWSRAHVDFDDAMVILPLNFNFTLFDLKSHKPIGYAVGLTFVACERFSFTLERRFSDERATYINAQFRL